MGAPAYANRFVTPVASFIGVNGLGYNGRTGNDVIAFLFQSLVVLPTLVAPAFRVLGFRAGARVKS